jgi:hypothetical protein
MASAARRRRWLRFMILCIVFEHAVLRLLAVGAQVAVLDGADEEVDCPPGQHRKQKIAKYTL